MRWRDTRTNASAQAACRMRTGEMGTAARVASRISIDTAPEPISAARSGPTKRSIRPPPPSVGPPARARSRLPGRARRRRARRQQLDESRTERVRGPPSVRRHLGGDDARGHPRQCRTMLARSLSRITARTMGGAAPASSTYDARASAPAGLCAASISTSPPPCAATQLAGHRASARPARTASVPTARPAASAISSTRTAVAALATWCGRERQAHSGVDALAPRVAHGRHPWLMLTSPSTRRLQSRRTRLGRAAVITARASGGSSPTTSGTSRLAMPALLGRDRRQGRAEVTFVVEGDRGDGAADRRDHRRRIETATQTHFDHRDVHLCARNASNATAW